MSISTRESRLDPLTQLSNRAALSEGFGRVTSLAARSREDVSVAILDVDHFKLVNDTYGHSVGDKVLVELANHLKVSLRTSDIIGRWGGEEFVIIFPGVGRSGSKWALEKSLDGFRKIPFSTDDGSEFSVTFSGGVVNVMENSKLDDMVAAADHLLYQAKESGRNKIIIEDDKIIQEPKQILLAEDDELVAKTIIHKLSKVGWEVLHYPDGESALKAAIELTPALVLMDVKMPAMDGFDLLENLQKITHYRKIPLVMLTSMGSEADIVRAFDLGAIDYIMKPFSPVELVARIRRLIKD